MNFKYKKLIIGAGAIVIAGIILCFTAFAMNGFNFSKFGIKPSYVDTAISLTETPISAISITADDNDLVLSKSTDDKIHIRMNDKTYSSVIASDTLVIGPKHLQHESFKDFFSSPHISFNLPETIEIAIPENAKINLTADTDESEILLDKISLDGNINIMTDDENIILDTIFSTGDIILTSSDGRIIGTINDSMQSYTINSYAEEGKSNLPEIQNGGAKKLIAKTEDEDISIMFLK